MSSLHERLLAAPPWTVVTERDLSYLRVWSSASAAGPGGSGQPGSGSAGALDDEVLVVACDSDGGLGPKPADTVKVDGGELGRFATRVPLLELVAAGAIPVLVVDTLSVERDPTGQAILAGVLAEAANAGLPATAVTGSTEDNVPTVATGVGVTVLGRARVGDLRAGTASAPFEVLLLGRPMSAPAELFGPDHPEVLTVPALMAALGVPGVLEALPIGSHGVMHEYRQLAASAGATPRPSPAGEWPVHPDQSGGPSTAALLAVHVAHRPGSGAAPAAEIADPAAEIADPAAEIARLVAEIARLTAKPVWHLGSAT